MRRIVRIAVACVIAAAVCTGMPQIMASADSAASVSPSSVSMGYTGSSRLSISTAQPHLSPTVRLIGPRPGDVFFGSSTTVDASGQVISTTVGWFPRDGAGRLVPADPGPYTVEVCDDPTCSSPAETAPLTVTNTPPLLENVSASTIAAGASIPFAITGDMFSPGATVTIAPPGGLSFTDTAMYFPSAASGSAVVAGTLTASPAATGSYDITVTDTAGQSSTLRGAVTIGVDPDLHTVSITPAAQRPGSVLFATGDGMQPGAGVTMNGLTSPDKLVAAPGGGFIATSPTGLAPGAVNVLATNPDTSGVYCAACFRAVTTRAPDPVSHAVGASDQRWYVDWVPQTTGTGDLPVLGYVVWAETETASSTGAQVLATATPAVIAVPEPGHTAVVAVASYTAAGLSLPTRSDQVNTMSWPTRPAAPRDVTLAIAPRLATLRWLPPAADGGAPIDHYHVTLQPAGLSMDTADTTLVFRQGLPLTAGFATVTAVTTVGNSDVARSPTVSPIPLGTRVCSGTRFYAMCWRRLATHRGLSPARR